MDEHLKLVADFETTMITDFFAPLNRQGPGSNRETRKALNLIGNLPQNAKITDIGCGTGGQTLALAENTPGTIVAIDVFPKMIDGLNDRMKQTGYNDKVSGVIASMENLPFTENELDLIWAEGSIYNIGYQKGLTEWKKFLKPGGFIAVSEVSWFTAARPEEIDRFWNFNYAEIDTISNKIKIMEETGYIPVAHFILPEYCWTDNFYKPMLNHIDSFLKQYDYSETAKAFARRQTEEIEYYHKYKPYYGYVFYIGKKI